MNTTKALFSELVYDFQSERWNEFELPKLSLRELQTLAKLLGCPSYGIKETLIVRLLAQRELRFKVARFTDNPDELAISYRRESLRDMCREAGIWRSGNKRALGARVEKRLHRRERHRAHPIEDGCRHGFEQSCHYFLAFLYGAVVAGNDSACAPTPVILWERVHRWHRLEADEGTEVNAHSLRFKYGPTMEFPVLR